MTIIKGTLSGTGAQRVYSPQANFSGTDSFSFRVSDGSAQSAIATVSTSVDARMPVANDGSYSLDMSLKKAPSKLLVRQPGVLANDSDDDSLSATLISPPAKGKLKLNRDGSFIFTPPNAKTATYVFTYRASDGQHTDTATVTISVVDKSQR